MSSPKVLALADFMTYLMKLLTDKKRWIDTLRRRARKIRLLKIFYSFSKTILMEKQIIYVLKDLNLQMLMKEIEVKM